MLKRGGGDEVKVAEEVYEEENDTEDDEEEVVVVEEVGGGGELVAAAAAGRHPLKIECRDSMRLQQITNNWNQGLQKKSKVRKLLQKEHSHGLYGGISSITPDGKDSIIPLNEDLIIGRYDFHDAWTYLHLSRIFVCQHRLFAPYSRLLVYIS